METAYQPVIKWFGSKRTVSKILSSCFPPCNTYYEPFVGGGAMMPFAVSKKGVAGDIIPELINLWKAIKNNPKEVADEYRKRWNRLQAEGADVYYEVRDSFNKSKDTNDFLFITRTCVNGMIRYNAQGEFNNSFHLSRPGINPESLEHIIFQWNRLIKKFDFYNADYHETLADVKKGDFVFLDPPYGGTKDRYTKKAFDLDAFYKELDRLNALGAKWMLTFDGSAGERAYDFAPPVETYKHKFSVHSGNSSFSKLIDKKKEQISESVYLNFDMRCLSGGLFQNVDD